MPVQLDEMFDEPPGVVAAVLSHAIESAGWRLLHVSESGDRVVWEIDDDARGTARLTATLEPAGEGAHMRVVSQHDLRPGPRDPGPAALPGEQADVIDLYSRIDGPPGFGPGTDPPFGLS